jgi:hypothetical protein
MPDAITVPEPTLPTWGGQAVTVVKAFNEDVQATVTAGLAAGQTAYGYTMQENDVVLALTPHPHVHSGIYVVGAASGSRHPQADQTAEFPRHLRVPISGTGPFAGRTARYSGKANPVIGTDGLPFTFDPVPITPP